MEEGLIEAKYSVQGESSVDYGAIPRGDGARPVVHEPGQSSNFDTLSNSVNQMMGVGILALPFALKQAGWLGVIFLALCAMLTLYTAHTLGRCADTDMKIQSYAGENVSVH
jgi:vesicular inhibitory amino acid transporter